MELPDSQYAVELVGKDSLRLNSEKPVYRPGPYQILAKVEAVGLCFSDLKLLKQFDKHPRKGRIIGGIEPCILDQIPSYKPDSAPTVPGHECVCRVVATGSKVKSCRVGERYLVQTDYRWLRTAGSNAAFGYNFEGALQQYVLMDERIIVDPISLESMLIPVGEELSAASVALVEPWACVESSYISENRRHVKESGKLLVVYDKYVICDRGMDISSAERLIERYRPSVVVRISLPDDSDKINNLPVREFDDIVYFGASADIIEALEDKLAAGGIMNIVLCGKSIERKVSLGIGRTHYEATRWIGTVGSDCELSYNYIPATGEIRRHDKILILGAAGPMGQMHLVRNLCTGLDGIRLTAADIDNERLSILEQKARVVSSRRSVEFSVVNPREEDLSYDFDYFAIMVPSAELVAECIKRANKGALINIFAGIPVSVRFPIDLDGYIKKSCFMFGTSGSTVRDMRIVLKKMEEGLFDTNISVDAISGMKGAIDGIRAVEDRSISGKVIVYPQIVDLELFKISELENYLPEVGRLLGRNKIWNKRAEDSLFAHFKG